MKKRVLSLLLALVLLVTALLSVLPAAEAAKTTKKRAIAIVFDNSSSMYICGSGYPDPNYRWNRATYAMEVFASMLNEGDTLYVFPMNPITVDGKEYANEDPLVISGPKDADKIHRIYSPAPGNTPMEPMKYANEMLNRITADEKYLIVLTDGDQFCEGTGQQQRWYSITDKYFAGKLGEYSEGVQFMYLGIDPPKANGTTLIPAEVFPERQHHVTAQSTELLPALTQLCNQIFGRDVLPVQNDQIDFDVTMKKLIIFVQGENISNVAISGGTRVNERITKYVEKGAGACGDSGVKKEYNEVDTSLQGMLVTYEDIDPGKYTIEYDGTASSVAVYYEPEVSVKVWLTDLNDNEVDPDNVFAGTYRLHYAIADKYGNLTDSALLENVTFSIPYPGSATPHVETKAAGEAKRGYIELELAEGDKIEGPYQATYLKDFTTDPTYGVDFGWPSGGISIKPIPKGTAALQVTGGGNYSLTRLEKEAEFRVKVLYDGQQVTGSDLDRAKLNVEIKNGNVRWQSEQTEDGFIVRLQYNGTPADTQCGDQSIAFTVIYTNSFGKACDPVSASKEFHIEDDSQALYVELVQEQAYYLISQLETSAPISAQLSIGGAPLTPEQFAGITKVDVTIDGIACDVQPDAANSRYLITMKNGEGLQVGDYTVKCHVEGINGLGKPAQADATTTIELQNLPLWVRVLLWILGALIALLLIWLYLNAKVLPKDIRIAPGGMFNVDGEMIPGQIRCSYIGKNKKRGSLKVQSPQYAANPLAACGFTLELEAISPRRTRSTARSVLVRSINPLNSNNTQSLQVGTCTLSKDPNTGKLTKAGTKPGAPIEARIGNNAKTMVMAEVMDMTTGDSITCTLSATLRFY